MRRAGREAGKEAGEGGGEDSREDRTGERTGKERRGRQEEGYLRHVDEGDSGSHPEDRERVV